MKDENALNVREEELLCFLWEAGEPMTSAEMAEKLQDAGWNSITVFKTVQSLTQKEYLEVKGLQKMAKTYARKLAPVLSKEEYYSSLLKKRGFDGDSLAGFVTSFLGLGKKDRKKKDAQAVKELENIIKRLQEEAGTDEQ